MTVKEMKNLGIEQFDFIYVSGDAYVDHPAFCTAIITRVVQSMGFTVGIIAQPDWHSTDDFKKLGKPKYAFLVSSGNMDSMVNHYTVSKKPRSSDSYSEGGKTGKRPDRALIVYCNRLKEAYNDVPVVIGGLEASLRRFAHYDYWDNRVRASILFDSGADLLLYGMGEHSIRELAEALESGLDIKDITYIAGSCYKAKNLDSVYDYEVIDSFESVAENKSSYAKAFRKEYEEQDAIKGKRLVQQHGKSYLVANPPALPLTQDEFDYVYELPYTRRPHPSYKEKIPALDEVEFSLTSCRGCYGACSFCALTFHQGRVIQARSQESLIREAKLLTKQDNFKGYIHDVGGPTANFRKPACKKQLKEGVCKNRQCLGYNPCKNVEVSHSDYITLLRRLRELKGIKKVFVRSGIRYDYVMYDKDDTFLRELIANHVSGHLKVAPEHINERVLELMGKPSAELYKRFSQKFDSINKNLGLKQYLVPYMISSHPGCDMNAAIELAQWIAKTGQHPEQVQDFYPTPGTLSTAMYWTGLNPLTMEKVYVPKNPREKEKQRALMQFFMPQYAHTARQALIDAGRDDLIDVLFPHGIPRRKPKSQDTANKNDKYGGTAKSNRNQSNSQTKNNKRTKRK